jgi:hypothetical protein|tara:strand:+ start:1790 stop:1954 length:165 start_codon:yes stop_codon:yes gene_type:complete
MTASEATERTAALEEALRRAEKALRDEERAYRDRAGRRLRVYVAAASIAAFLAS